MCGPSPCGLASGSSLAVALTVAPLGTSGASAQPARACSGWPFQLGTGAVSDIRTRGVTCAEADRVIRGDESFRPKTVRGFACRAVRIDGSNNSAWSRCTRGSRLISGSRRRNLVLREREKRRS